MTATLSEQARALLDTPEYATIATIDPDGRPQLSLVWVGRDGDDVLFSTIRGRRKTDNLVRDARATLLMFAAANPYQYLEIRGTTTIADDPKADFIHEMARKYTGDDYQWSQPGEERVVVRLSPEHVVFRA